MFTKPSGLWLVAQELKIVSIWQAVKLHKNLFCFTSVVSRVPELTVLNFICSEDTWINLCYVFLIFPTPPIETFTASHLTQVFSLLMTIGSCILMVEISNAGWQLLTQQPLPKDHSIPDPSAYKYSRIWQKAVAQLWFCSNCKSN